MSLSSLAISNISEQSEEVPLHHTQNAHAASEKGRSTSLQDAGIADLSVATFAAIKSKHPKANYINNRIRLKDFDIKTEAETIVFAKTANKNLKSLDLSYFHYLTDKHLEELIAACPNLETITINSPLVTNKGLQTLLTLNLSSLGLIYCSEITDEGLKRLTDLNQLVFLDITGCMRITEKGLQYIAMLKQLQKLSIAQCWDITKETIQMLVASLPQLVVLDIRDCFAITDAEAQSLMDQFKDLQIITDTLKFPLRIHLEDIA